MKKKILIVSLTLIVTVSTIITLWWYYGLFSDYNYFTANQDIELGNVRFVSFGLPLGSSKNEEIDSLEIAYGFKTDNIGCIVTTQEINAIETYNNVVEQHLRKRNGNNWKMNYQRQIDFFI